MTPAFLVTVFRENGRRIESSAYSLNDALRRTANEPNAEIRSEGILIQNDSRGRIIMSEGVAYYLLVKKAISYLEYARSCR